jgi:hypothetical protein
MQGLSNSPAHDEKCEKQDVHQHHRSPGRNLLDEARALLHAGARAKRGKWG